MFLRVEKGISEGVVKNYCYSVGRFLRWVNTPNLARKDTVKDIDRLLKEKKKAATVKNILYALKHYYSFNGKELDLKAS